MNTCSWRGFIIYLKKVTSLLLFSPDIYFRGFKETATGVLPKKLFLNISQNLQENTCGHSPFQESCRPKGCRSIHSKIDSEIYVTQPILRNF